MASDRANSSFRGRNRLKQGHSGRGLNRLLQHSTSAKALESAVRRTQGYMNIRAKHGPVKVIVKNGVRLEVPEVIPSQKGTA